MRRALLLVALVALAAAAAGCKPDAPAQPDGGPQGCATGFAGDRSKAPEMVVVILAADGTVSDVADGGTVPLVTPPQGGQVIFAGARATNLDTCGVTIQGVLRDETTKQVTLDGRTIDLLPTSGGWAETDPTDASSFSNVPVCPNEWSPTNIYGTQYQLEVSLTDANGRMVSKTLPVVPQCAAGDANCHCICQGGYVLGMSCAVDGGAGGAGGGGG
jgi:hypothetical protein